MKKTLHRSLLLLLALMLAIVPTLALATARHNIPELNVSMELPESWSVITRDISGNDSMLSLLGLDRESTLELMEQSNLYLLAIGISDMTFSGFGGVSAKEGGLDIADLRDYNQAEIDSMFGSVDDLTAAAGLDALGLELGTVGTYDTSAARWIEIECSVMDMMYGTLYITVVDGMMYVQVLFKMYTEPTQGDISQSRQIVDSIRFGGSAGGGLPLWAWIAIGGAALIILVLVIVLITRGKKKKNPVGAFCPACGNPVRPDAAFCDKCGSVIPR